MNINKSKWIIAVGAVFVCGVSVFISAHLPAKETPAPDPIVAVQTAKAERKSIQQTITVEAILFPKNQAAISPKVVAPVKKFYVNRGAQVRAGQLLAVLENEDIAASVTENKGAYEQAQATYTTTIGASLPEDVKKSELDLKTAKEMLDAEQKLYDSRQLLFKEGALPRKDLDQAAVSLVQARAQYQLANQRLTAVQAIGRPQTLKLATGQLTSAKGKLEGATAQLKYSEIRSPINGVVTDRPINPGETPAAGMPLLTIMDISSVIARAHIPQEQAAVLRMGNTAAIATSDGATAKGIVSLISPALDPNSTTVEVWIDIPNKQNTLRPGTTVQAMVIAREEKNAVTIPASALLKSPEGANKVMVVGDDGVAHEREVEVGVRAATEIQITKGVNAGELVIATGAYGLPDKTHVKQEVTSSVAKPNAGKE